MHYSKAFSTDIEYMYSYVSGTATERTLSKLRPVSEVQRRFPLLGPGRKRVELRRVRLTPTTPIYNEMSTRERTPSSPEERDEFHGDLKQIADHCKTFIRHVVDDAAVDGVVVGLSGGIDSTTAAALAVDALGREQVYGPVLPADPSSPENIRDAQEQACELGIDFRTVDVQPVVDCLIETMTQDLLLPQVHDGYSVNEPDVPIRMAVDTDGAYKHTVGNTIARVRMMALYFEANLRNELVLGTGNRTEIALGYVTKHGDGGVDIQPLGDLYKTEVRALARHLGVPDEIVDKQPTAGLWEEQTDADELGAGYETIDSILRRLVDGDDSTEEIARSLDVDVELVGTYAEMYEGASHKRVTPPTPRTYSY